MRLFSICLCVLALLQATQLQGEDHSSAKALIEGHAEEIVGAAHPTVTYDRVELHDDKTLNDGFELVYDFHWHDDSKSAWTRLAFVFTPEGELDYISVRDRSNFLPPFTVASVMVKVMKEALKDDPSIDSREMRKLIENADAKGLLAYYLKVEQKDILGIAEEGAKVAGVVERSAPRLGKDDAELLELIAGSESMNDEERTEWKSKLAYMTAAQKAELRRILSNERDTLADIDRRFATKVRAVASAKDEGLQRTLESAFESSNARNFDAAIVSASKVIDSVPTSSDAYYIRAVSHFWKKDYTNALNDINKAIELGSKQNQLYYYRARCQCEMKDYRRATADYLRALEIAPESVEALNGYAWLLATCTDARFRDGAEAVKQGTKACQVTEWKNPFYFDTLAAAYAEAGLFDKAVEWQQKAVSSPDFEKAVGTSELAIAKKRLELFRASKPWRE